LCNYKPRPPCERGDGGARVLIFQILGGSYMHPTLYFCPISIRAPYFL